MSVEKRKIITIQCDRDMCFQETGYFEVLDFNNKEACAEAIEDLRNDKDWYHDAETGKDYCPDHSHNTIVINIP